MEVCSQAVKANCIFIPKIDSLNYSMLTIRVKLLFRLLVEGPMTFVSDSGSWERRDKVASL